MWLHKHNDWPNFTFDASALTSKLSGVRHRQGRLLGKVEGLGFALKCEASLTALTDDVVKSSAIEGERLDAEEVRSSIARRLGIDAAGLAPSSRSVEGVVAMTLDATQQFNQDLTNKRLFNWHTSLFPTGSSGEHPETVGGWRTVDAGSMQVVSGPAGREKVHFEAPHASRIETEMAAFLSWFNVNESSDPVIRSGLAHLWFVTIHPFEDGNGRIARAITDMALARADGTSSRFYSLSKQIESERKDYYEQLEHQQRSTPDATPWIEWFLGCLGRAIENAEDSLRTVLFKAQLWGSINQQAVNERQRLIINRMLEDEFKGHMNTSKYAKLAKCSINTASRDIQELKARGVLLQNPGSGRSTSYRLREKISE